MSIFKRIYHSNNKNWEKFMTTFVKISLNHAKGATTGSTSVPL